MSHLLEVSGVAKHFGGVQALKDVSLDAMEGQILGVIGPNGAGKTTLFNVVSGFVRADKGDMRLEGRQIGRLQPHQLARLKVTRTFQNLNVFSKLTVGQHIALARATVPRHSQEPLDWVGLCGLDRQWSQLASALPYGAQKRLDLCRALTMQPRLLLLDEPVAGLNATEKANVAQILRAANDQGVTMILVDHDMRFVMGLCSSISVISDGKDIAHGTPEEVVTNELVIEAYLGRRKVASAPHSS